ncbi:MAG: hypothetical protein GC152_05510 [Alphaproteobacteria bacterium]|nr:hypothetical protein [Alphaproteobacteria bacterium]
MSAIYTPSQDKEFFTPFGPMLGFYRMPPDLVDQLNAKMSDQLADHSDHLVGKVTQELRFDEELVQIAAQGLGQTLIEYHIRARTRCNFGDYDHRTKRFALDIMSGWFIRQFENEYNPLHIHTQCHLSCVGYLALPDGIEAEWEDDYQDHHPSHAHLQFAHGTDVHYSVCNFMVKPKVGEFWIFPSYMFHCVYPFKTKGERRSFSLNVSINEENVTAPAAPRQWSL